MSDDLSYEIAQSVLTYMEAMDLPEGTRLVIELNAMDFRNVDRMRLGDYLRPIPEPILATELIPKGTFRVLPAFPGTGAVPGRFNVVDPGPGQRPVIA